MPSRILIRAADYRPFELQELLPSDSRFKVLIFAGDTSHVSQRAKVAALATEMNATDGFLRSYSPHGNILAAFDIITISSAQNAIVRHTDMPELFRSHWSKLVLTFRILKNSHVHQSFCRPKRGEGDRSRGCGGYCTSRWICRHDRTI